MRLAKAIDDQPHATRRSGVSKVSLGDSASGHPFDRRQNLGGRQPFAGDVAKDRAATLEAQHGPELLR